MVSSMLAVSTAFGTWVPILAFPTLEAPKFFRGYVMEAVMQWVYFGWSVFVVWYAARDVRRKKEADDVAVRGE